jgi:hypothetical protein
MKVIEKIATKVAGELKTRLESGEVFKTDKDIDLYFWEFAKNKRTPISVIRSYIFSDLVVLKMQSTGAKFLLSFDGTNWRLEK